MAVPLQEIDLHPAVGQAIKIMAGRINTARKSATLYFPRQEAFHLRSVLGKAVWGDRVAAIKNWQPNLDGAANRQLSFNSNRAGWLQFCAAGEDKRQLNEKFMFKNGSNQFKYNLPGQEYNSVAFSWSDGQQLFWQTPTYIIGNAMVNTTVYTTSGKSVLSAPQGLYPAPPATQKLQKNGYPAIFDTTVPPQTLAVAQTLFWPEDNNHFHIAAGSLQMLHVIAVNPEEKLSGLPWQLDLFLPRDLVLENVTTIKQSSYRLHIAGSRELNINKQPFTHYVIKSNLAQKCKVKPDPHDVYTLLIRSTGQYDAQKRTRTAYVYAQWDNGRIVEVPQALTVNIYPPLAGKTPRLFQSEMWGGFMVNLADSAANLRFLTDTVQKSGFNRLQNFPVPGMKRFGVLAYQRIINPRAKKLYSQHPEYRKINSSGGVVSTDQANFICTDILINSPEIAEIARQELQRQLKDFDILCLDYEAPAKDGMLSCYCQRCLKAFAEFARLSTVPERQDIHVKYHQKWCDFMTGRIAQICRMWKNLVNAMNKELYFYSGYQSPKTLQSYSVDWRKLSGVIDRGGAGYTRTTAEIAATVKALKSTPLSSGVIAEPWHIYLRQQSQPISLAYLAAGLISGSKGFLVYNLPGCDGRSFHNFSQFNSFLADHEEALFNAERTRKGARVQGIDPQNYMLFRTPGQPSILICYSTDTRRRQIYVDLPFEKSREYFSGKSTTGKKFTFMLSPGEMAAFVEQP
ncbi:MAG: hypothetical protein E7052_06770 [Lentisphaerae bacterium]|nr:hypothetical protein [Lentisphaerota bacterium]